MSLLASPVVAATSSGGLNSVLDPIAKPIASVLAFIYSIVPNYGVAILVLSVLWMLLISPLTLKTTRSMLAMQKLQPQLKKLQEQHKNDRQAFAQAQMELFREHNASPFGACLPTLLPLPIFFALFRVIDGLSHSSHGQTQPQYLSTHTRMYHDIVAAHGHLNAFGLDLSHNALSSHSGILAALPFYILLLIMMGTQYLQSAQMMSRNPQAQDNPQAKMMKFLPLVFGVFCIRFPAGVVLYYAMSNVCRITQQSVMYRFDPKVRALAVREAEEVEAITREIDEADDAKRNGGTKGSRAKATPAPGRGASDGSKAPPSRKRFRDVLAQVSDQQQAAKEQAVGRAAERQATKGSGGRPGTGAAKRPASNPTAKAGNGRSNGSGANRANGNGSGASKAGGNGSAGATGNGSGRPTRNGSGKPTGKSGSGAAKAIGDGTPRPPSPVPNGNGNGDTKASGPPTTKSDTGNGRPPGNGRGRTGAGAGASNRKRRGR